MKTYISCEILCTFKYLLAFYPIKNDTYSTQEVAKFIILMSNVVFFSFSENKIIFHRKYLHIMISLTLPLKCDRNSTLSVTVYFYDVQNKRGIFIKRNFKLYIFYFTCELIYLLKNSLNFFHKQ